MSADPDVVRAKRGAERAPIERGCDPWIDLPHQKERGEKKSRIWRRLEYMGSNMNRLAADWRAHWLNIGITS
jgi:hypothetical protein